MQLTGDCYLATLATSIKREQNYFLFINKTTTLDNHLDEVTDRQQTDAQFQALVVVQWIFNSFTTWTAEYFDWRPTRDRVSRRWKIGIQFSIQLWMEKRLSLANSTSGTIPILWMDIRSDWMEDIR